MDTQRLQTAVAEIGGRVEDIEDSQSRHRQLLAEMAASLHKMELQLATFIAQVNTIISVGRMTLGALGAIALLVLTAMIGRWIK